MQPDKEAAPGFFSMSFFNIASFCVCVFFKFHYFAGLSTVVTSRTVSIHHWWVISRQLFPAEATVELLLAVDQTTRLTWDVPNLTDFLFTLYCSWLHFALFQGILHGSKPLGPWWTCALTSKHTSVICTYLDQRRINDFSAGRALPDCFTTFLSPRHPLWSHCKFKTNLVPKPSDILWETALRSERFFSLCLALLSTPLVLFWCHTPLHQRYNSNKWELWQQT